MKKYFLIAILFSLTLGCGMFEDKDQAAKERDSLMKLLDNKDQTINDFMASLNEIQTNLDSVKMLEGMISTSTKTNVEMGQSQKDKVNDDVVAIYRIMMKNKQMMKALNRKMKKANVKIAELEKLIANMTKQIAAKDAQIEDLKNQLAKSVLDVNNLNQEIKQMSANLDSLHTKTKEKEKVIEQKTSELNTVYYVYGTKKELTNQKILAKEGGFVGIGGSQKLSETFNKDYFTKIDLTRTTAIPIFSKKAKVITNHPPASYYFSGKDKIDSLIIKAPKDFWSVSKYLVIVVE